MTIYMLTAVYTTNVICSLVWKVFIMNTDVHCHSIVPAISLLAMFSLLIQECIIQPYVTIAHIYIACHSYGDLNYRHTL